MVVIQILLIILFLVVFYQDWRDRMVTALLYPLIGLVSFMILTSHINLKIALINSCINLLFILIVLGIVFLYNKLFLRLAFFEEVLGIGDVMFFIFITFSFSVISFLVLFVLSLFFSYSIYRVLIYKKGTETVPLAGLMSLFFSLVYFINLFISSNYLFAI